jgi:hypothetical protein
MSVEKALSGDAADCLARASACLAACSRPALHLGSDSTPEQLSAALTELVAAAEMFGCSSEFWRWAARAAALLGRGADSETFGKRSGGET